MFVCVHFKRPTRTVWLWLTFLEPEINILKPIIIHLVQWLECHAESKFQQTRAFPHQTACHTRNHSLYKRSNRSSSHIFRFVKSPTNYYLVDRLSLRSNQIICTSTGRRHQPNNRQSNRLKISVESIHCAPGFVYMRFVCMHARAIKATDRLPSEAVQSVRVMKLTKRKKYLCVTN